MLTASLSLSVNGPLVLWVDECDIQKRRYNLQEET